MPLVKVKSNFQVTIPHSVRRKAHLSIGDILEAEVHGKRITLTVKSAIQREIAQGLEDFKHGRSIGPFRTAKTAIRALRRSSKSRSSSRRALCASTERSPRIERPRSTNRSLA